MSPHPAARTVAPATPQVEQDGERARLIACARRAIEAIDRAIPEPTAELKQDVDVAERAIAELRDCLIHALRRAPDGPDAQRRRQLLDRVNVALSLVAGVEYPSAGIQRKQLEQARDVLRQARVYEV
jgi:hypothetical protein